MHGYRFIKMVLVLIVVFSCPLLVQAKDNGDLDQIKARGELRHLGVVYANFVTGSGDGFSVELMQEFADYLGVEYQYVHTTWANVIPDLIGKDFQVNGNQVKILGERKIKGDIISNGLTILDWRKKLLMYSKPIFRTQVWLIAAAESNIQPIKPSGNTEQDIQAVKEKINGLSILGKKGTCLDPSLYNLKDYGAETINFQESINKLAPAVMNQEAESTILDVPDSLIALQKWAGKIKIVGPVSHRQNMGVGFRKTSPELLEAFNSFLQKIKESGRYRELVRKYYPNVFDYYPEFFD